MKNTQIWTENHRSYSDQDRRYFYGPFRYTLQSRNSNASQLHFCGNLVLNLHYKAPGSLVAYNKRDQRKLPNPTKGELKISLMKAKDLMESHHDMYCCKLSLVLSKSVLKMKSQVVCVSLFFILLTRKIVGTFVLRLWKNEELLQQK